MNSKRYVGSGVHAILDCLARLTDISPYPYVKENAEWQSFKGVLSLEVESLGVWLLSFDGKLMTISRTSDISPRTFVTISPEDFVALVVGKQSYTTAELAGRIKIDGDRHFGLIFAVFMQLFADARKAAGPAGWFAKAMIDLTILRED